VFAASPKNFQPAFFLSHTECGLCKLDIQYLICITLFMVGTTLRRLITQKTMGPSGPLSYFVPIEIGSSATETVRRTFSEAVLFSG